MDNSTTHEFDIFIQQDSPSPSGGDVNFLNIYKKYEELSKRIDERLDKIRRKNGPASNNR